MLLASPASYFFARRQQAAWAKAIWICILILVFGAHQLDTGLNEKDRILPFHTKVNTYLWGEILGLYGNMIVGYKHNKEDAATPINILLWLRIVNMQPVQSKISAYRLQFSESQNGPWKTLNPVHIQGRQFYMTSSVTNLKKITGYTLDEQDLGHKLRLRTLQPGAKLEGWMAFERTDVDLTKTHWLRFYLRDTTGVESLQILQPPNAQSFGEITLGEAEIKSIGTRDISRFHFRRFSLSYPD
jgi:hypothetical protein